MKTIVHITRIKRYTLVENRSSQEKSYEKIFIFNKDRFVFYRFLTFSTKDYIMKKLFLTMTLLILGTSFVVAASATDMTTKWTCTTNASSSDLSRDKASDDQMSKATGSVGESFAYAAKNCRDCTKITCEAKD
jgi:hypothetical protein